jgi:hypothetical protein
MWAHPRGEKPGYRDIIMLPETGCRDTGKIYTNLSLVLYGSLAIGDLKAAGFKDTGDRHEAWPGGIFLPKILAFCFIKLF